jgi:hypothetical protein
MKKVVGLLVILFTAAFLPAVSANEKPAIAIIDTAIDTAQVNVFHEVCLMEEKQCPNKQSYMEGPGSAHMPASRGFEHGTQMVQIAQQVNPNMNIVFIRIYPQDRRGNIAKNAANVNSTVRQALEWVVNNKAKFNIVAVSASVGETKFSRRGHYCPVNSGIRNAIVSLQNLGVASIFAAGNRYDYARVDYPSCIAEAISVSSVGVRGNVERYSNRSAETDFFALGTIGSSTGTSAATVALASYWAKNYKGNFSDTYNYFKSIAKSAFTEGFTTNLFVDVLN